jgi:hypothetical protein
MAGIKLLNGNEISTNLKDGLFVLICKLRQKTLPIIRNSNIENPIFKI